MVRLGFILCFLTISSTFAGDIKLPDITQNDLDQLSEEFSANFVHTTVSPAYSLGETWGVEFGLLAGVTKSHSVERLVHETDPDADIDMIPHAGLLGMVSIPWGITFEATGFPSKTISDVTLKTFSTGVRWTFTDVIFSSLPVDIAIRAHYMISEISFTQNINNASTANQDVASTISYDSTVWGANLTVSGDLLFLEPFAGIGIARGDSTLKVDAALTGQIPTIFDSSFTSAQSASSSPSSTHYFAGLQLDLWLIHISAEYAKVFKTERYTGKFSLYF